MLRPMPMDTPWHLIGLLGMAALAGCGGSAPFEQTPVSGQVTYEDGSPLPTPVLLSFYPQTPPVDPKTHPRPETARTDATGKFDEATTMRWGDGLISGRHKMVISSTTGVLREIPPGVAPEYNDLTKTPLQVDTSDAPFLLKVRKP